MNSSETAKKNTCRICGLTAAHSLWRMRYTRTRKFNETFPYFQCASCGCLQIEEVPLNLSDYYQDDYYSLGQVSERKLRDRPLRKYLRMAGAVVGTSQGWYGRLARRFFSMPVHHEWFSHAGVSFSSRILDAGCGSASHLVRIWKEGFRNVLGIDPFLEEDIRYSSGLVVKKAGLNDLSGDESYDLIMMNHSLEHIPDQHQTLGDIARLLKPNGRVLIRVPVASFAWERYRENWVFIAAPEHIYLHTETSMKALAKAAGFEVEKVIYDSQGFQFWGSELCAMGIPLSEHKENMGRFTDAQIQEWEKEAKRLNREHKGDMACFYLTLTARQDAHPTRPFPHPVPRA